MINNILLVDDDADFFETFQREAQLRSMRVTHKKSFDGLKQMIPAYQRSFAAVVLDIKCLISDDQIKEDEGFIGTALAYLNSSSAGFPRLILTGDDAAFASLKSFNPDEKIFLKTPDGLKGVFNQLKYFVDNSLDLAIKRKNSEVFKLFDSGYFDQHSEELLLEVLKSAEEVDFVKFGGILRNIRALQETIYKVINKKSKAAVPDIFFQTNGMIKFNPLMKHLNGNPSNNDRLPTTSVYQNQAIFNLSDCLYWTSGKYIHSDPDEQYLISKYTIAALIGALMELFLWARLYLK